jgi:haloalkane dehalogenase
MTNLTPGQRPGWVDDELLPFDSRFIEIDGHIIHYLDEGAGPVLLLYHGNPAWSFLYRHVIGGLRDRFLCLAFDHPGMGLSSGRRGFAYRASEFASVAEILVSSALTCSTSPPWSATEAVLSGLAPAARHPAATAG